MVAGVAFVDDIGVAVAEFAFREHKTLDAATDGLALRFDCVHPAAAVAQWCQRIDDCLQQLPVVGVYGFQDTLKGLASLETPEVAAAARVWSEGLEARQPPGWLLDIASDCIEPDVPFHVACREAGLSSRAFVRRTPKGALTRAAAIGLMAAREINLCTWSRPVNVDAVVRSALQPDGQYRKPEASRAVRTRTPSHDAEENMPKRLSAL